MARKWLQWISIMSTLLLGLSTAASAQAIIRAQIAGTVTDESAAALPGVSIVLTSPALQVPQVQRVSDAEGRYLFADLPAGTYRLSYELPGFTTLVREDVRLSTGFAARLDVVLKLGNVAETITVTGQSPLIDVTNTRGGTIVTKELLQELPSNRNFQDVYVAVGGVQIPGPPLTGGGGQRETGTNISPKTYGLRMMTQNSFEGLVVLSNEIPNFASFDEVDVKSYGNTAESANPSAIVNMVIKSGGNQFHGRYSDFAQGDKFQSTNVDAALRRQGITVGDAMVFQNDFTGDLGGRIIRDKLWFYYAAKDVRGTRTVPGFVSGPGPDGVYLTGDEPIGKVHEGAPAQTYKISFQPNPSHRFVSFWTRTPLFEREQGASRFVPLESTVRHVEIDWAFKPIDWQWVINSRTNFNIFGGASGLKAWRRLQAGFESATPTLDRQTGYSTGASFLNVIGTREPRRRAQVIGRLDYFPVNEFLGTHAITVGFRYERGGFLTNFQSLPDGNYQLIYDTVGGVPHQPVEISTQDRPTVGDTLSITDAAYVSDSWRPSKRLTLNLGLRWDRNANSVPALFKPQGAFGTSGNIPAVDAGTFTSVVPRFGAAYDVFGDGHTVVKGSWGLFKQEWFQAPSTYNVGFAYDYNQGVVTTRNYRWTDPTHCNCYVPGTVNLDVNGLAFVSISGATNNIPNLTLKKTGAQEVTSSIEQALGRTLSLRALYVYKRNYRDMANYNTLRPFSAWNQVFTRRDPGPDGVLGTADDGGMVTFYDYNPAYRGAAFVAITRVNADSNHDDTYNNVEVSLTKRPSQRWFANASFLATKYHVWFNPVPASPNDLLFPLNQVWERSGRVAAGYTAPFGIELSTLTQAYDGVPRQRTYTFRAADPAGGPSLPSSSTITVPMEPYGAHRGPKRTIVNLRGARTFKLAKGAITADISAFNAFNSNVPWSTGGSGSTGDSSGITDASGPTYNFVTRIVNPRILRFGLTFEF
jgi:carboxypeptidase family protein